MRRVKIIGTGKYLPKRIVTATEMDSRLKVHEGWTERITGVKNRHFVENETNSDMAAYAIKEALSNAKLSLSDVDCIVSTSGTMEQAIPCNASLIQEKLGLVDSGIPCFDVNSTCLGFVTGLDVVSYMVDSNRYKNAILVSSEIASVGLDWDNKESAALFGDGAVAAIIQKTPDDESSSIITSKMETYSRGAHLSEIKAGGTSKHPRRTELDERDYLFDMNGKAIFKLSSKLLPGFVERVFSESGFNMEDIKLVIPHQASTMAMRIIQKKLDIPEGRFFNFIENHGNMISASIPLGIHEAISKGLINRGDKVLLLGTSAGLSLGGMIFEY